MECKRCGYIWEPRGNPPKQCPKCKQYYYNKPAGWEYTEPKERTPKESKPAETKQEPDKKSVDLE